MLLESAAETGAAIMIAMQIASHRLYGPIELL